MATPLPVVKRLDSLTSLRFFAAFGVFVHHFTGLGGSTGLGRGPLLFPYSQIGAYGVEFFFVLSGFLLTWVWRPGERAGSYYWRRFGRIWPAMIATMPLAILAYYTMAHVPINRFGLLMALLCLQTWFPHIQPTLPGNEVAWTLSVEVLFYALFPLLVRWAMRLPARALAAASAAGLLAMYAVCWWSTVHLSGAMSAWVMRNPLVYLPVFLTGMTAAVWLRRGHRMRLHPAVPIALLLVLTYGYYQGVARLPESEGAQLTYLLRPAVTVLAVLIIVAFVQREMRGRAGVMNNPLLVRLGVWSYAFYLLHHSVTRIIEYHWGRLPDSDVTIFTLIGIGVVINLMAWAVYELIEAPFERWWRTRMPRRWRSVPAAAAARPERAVVQAPIG